MVAVAGVDLEIREGEFFSLLGPSGCGKTTCLRMIAGFEEPTAGRIVLHGRDVAGLPAYDRDVNTVFQDYALFPHMSVHDNVEYGLLVKGVGRGERSRRVVEALRMMQLERFGRRKPGELSGGQRQRVALARALAKTPKLLLLDEPLAALDRKLRAETRLELIGIQERVGTTFLLVTHDQEEALGMASRIAVMNRGRVVQIGSPAEIYERPGSRFVADFVGEVNLFEGELTAGFNCLALAVAGFDRPIPLPSPSGIALPEGAAAALALRPERLRLCHERPPGFAVAATVASVSYLGGTSIVHLLAGGGRPMKARLPAGADCPPRGSAVWASWSPDEGVLITQ